MEFVPSRTTQFDVAQLTHALHCYQEAKETFVHIFRPEGEPDKRARLVLPAICKYSHTEAEPFCNSIGT